jgi:hypothetical protein
MRQIIAMVLGAILVGAPVSSAVAQSGHKLPFKDAISGI